MTFNKWFRRVVLLVGMMNIGNGAVFGMDGKYFPAVLTTAIGFWLICIYDRRVKQED